MMLVLAKTADTSVDHSVARPAPERVSRLAQGRRTFCDEKGTGQVRILLIGFTCIYKVQLAFLNMTCASSVY